MRMNIVKLLLEKNSLGSFLFILCMLLWEKCFRKKKKSILSKCEEIYSDCHTVV